MIYIYTHFVLNGIVLSYAYRFPCGTGHCRIQLLYPRSVRGAPSEHSGRLRRSEVGLRPPSLRALGPRVAGKSEAVELSAVCMIPFLTVKSQVVHLLLPNKPWDLCQILWRLILPELTRIGTCSLTHIRVGGVFKHPFWDTWNAHFRINMRLLHAF